MKWFKPTDCFVDFVFENSEQRIAMIQLLHRNGLPIYIAGLMSHKNGEAVTFYIKASWLTWFKIYWLTAHNFRLRAY